MSTVLTQLPAIGAAFQGGYFAGVICDTDMRHAVIVAPKASGESSGVWTPSYADTKGARSFSYGLANTDAMAEAGSELAKWARSQRIGDLADWYIPARDELELLYRNLKPTTAKSYPRCGDNPSSVPVGYPYDEDMHVQTSAEAFRHGGAEALADVWYWSSTQFSRDGAWTQNFYFGGQYYNCKSDEARCRLVRRFTIE